METAGQTSYSPTAIKILDAATRLFMQRGYHAVSINDIVHAAEVTKPTLYYHFADKEELFVQMVLRMLAELRADMEAAMAGKASVDAQLVALADVLRRSGEGDMLMIRREIAEHLGAAQRQRISAAFQRDLLGTLQWVMHMGLERGELARHSSVELAWLFLGLIEAFHQSAGAAERAAPPEYAATFSAETLVALFLHGVSRAHAPDGQPPVLTQVEG
jgi:AcrR family transcriptional regulator